MKEYNYNFDKVKWIAALGVVLVHVFPFIDRTYDQPLADAVWSRSLFTFGVPTFFAISGYILSQKPSDYAKKYQWNIFRLFLAYSIFYYMTSYLLGGLTATQQQLPLMDGFMQAFQNRNRYSFMNGTFGSYHLWFMWAMWLSILTLYFGIRQSWHPKWMFIGNCAFYIVSLYLMEQNEWINIFKYGGFPKGLAFMTLGYTIGRTALRWKPYYILGVVTAFLYLWFDSQRIGGKLAEVFLLPSIAMLIIWLVNHPGQSSWLSRLAKQSTAVYILHALAIDVYGQLLLRWSLFDISSLGLRIIVITLFAVIFSIILYPVLDSIYVQPMFRIMDSLRDRILSLGKGKEIHP